VATDVGSLPEMIDEGRGGHLLKVGDLEGFKRALLSFNELHVRQEAGRYNRLKAKKEYSFSAVMDRLIECYKILCKN
jgi:glycosyltransferase involved in cell wall biosynthesis